MADYFNEEDEFEGFVDFSTSEDEGDELEPAEMGDSAAQPRIFLLERMQKEDLPSADSTSSTPTLFPIMGGPRLDHPPQQSFSSTNDDPKTSAGAGTSSWPKFSSFTPSTAPNRNSSTSSTPSFSSFPSANDLRKKKGAITSSKQNFQEHEEADEGDEPQARSMFELDTSKDRDPSQRKSEKKKHKSPLDYIRPNDAFCIDSRRDKDIAQGLYGGVPKYRRYGSGLVVGLKPHERVVWDDGRGPGRNGSMDSTKKSDMERAKASVRYFGTHAMEDELNPLTQWITLIPPPEQKKKTSRWDSKEQIASDALFLPFSHPHALSSLKGETKEEINLRKTKQFNEYLRANPTDVSKWRQFIKFQEEVIDNRSGKNLALLQDKKLALYEEALKANPSHDSLMNEYLDLCRLRMAPEEFQAKWRQLIFADASSIRRWRAYLSYVASDLSSFRFSSAQQYYFKGIDTFSKLLKGTFVSHQIMPVTALRALFEITINACHFFRQAGFGERGLCVLQALYEYNILTPADPAHANFVFFETYFDSGLPRIGEKGAIGFGQWATMRKLMGVESSSHSFPRYLDEHPPSDPPPVTAESVSHLWVAYEQWRESAHWAPWRPCEDKGESEDSCDDPERIVLYDDIQPLLFQISSQEVKMDLIFELLKYLGVETMPCTDTNHSRFHQSVMHLVDANLLFHPLWEAVLLMRAREFYDIESRSLVESDVSDLMVYFGHHFHSLEAESSSRRTAGLPFSGNPRVWGCGPLLPLQDLKARLLNEAKGQFVSSLMYQFYHHEYRDWLPSPAIDDESKISFIRRLLENAVSVHPGNKELLRQYLLFEAYVDIKQAKKVLKGIMKDPTNRNNLELFDFYALLELRAGKHLDARKIYQTALLMSLSLPHEARAFSYTLCYHYSFFELQQNNTNIALSFLSAFILEDQARLQLLCDPSHASSCALPSSPTLLKTRSSLQHALQQQLVAGLCNEHKAGLVNLYYLFSSLAFGVDELLKVHGEVVGLFDKCRGSYCLSAMGVASNSGDTFNRYLSDTQEMSPPLTTHDLYVEKCFMTVLSLLQLLSSRKPTVSSKIRVYVGQGVLRYPNNPFLLSQFILSEAAFKISGRIRKHFETHIFDSSTQHPTKLIQWLFAIHAEMSLYPGALHSHRVRLLFERAADIGLVQSSTLLWRMFMDFEFHQERGLQKSQGVFYRALQAIPGSKALYIDAVRHNPSILQEVLDLLQEKELHLRTPLEELDL